MMIFKIYICIALLFGTILTYDYIEEIKSQYNKANSRQKLGIVIIAFIINVVLFPIALIEKIIKKTKERKGAKR